MKNVLTLSEKIDKLVKDCSGKEGKINQEELKKGILKLVERATHPEYFCPKCDEKMFYEIDKGNFNCLNCGYKSEAKQVTQPQQTKRPSQTGKVPPQVENTIQEAKKSMQEPPRVVKKTALGDKIRKLRDSIDSGGTPPSKLDTARLKNIDSNIRDVNWV